MDKTIIYSKQYVVDHTFTTKIVPSVDALVKINGKAQNSITAFMGTTFSYICSADGYETYQDNGVIGGENEEVNITLTPLPHKLLIKTNVDAEDLPNQIITMKIGDNELTDNNISLYPGEEVTVSVVCPGYRPVHDVNIVMGVENMEYQINLIKTDCTLTFLVEPLLADITITKHNDTVMSKYCASNTPLTDLAIGDTIEYTITETGYEPLSGTVVIDTQNKELHIKMQKIHIMVNFFIYDFESSKEIKDAKFILNGMELEHPYKYELPVGDTYRYSVYKTGYLDKTGEATLMETDNEVTIYINEDMTA